MRDARRDFLLALLGTALAAVGGRRRMRAALTGRDDLEGAWILAIGKAAPDMTLGVLDALGKGIDRALVIARDGDFPEELGRVPGVQCLAGSHPVPDSRSLAAGAAALEFAGRVPQGRPVLLLVSGGASSLLESLPAGVSLDDLRRVTAWALSSGEPIQRVNAVRRRLSRVKDGRLLARLGHARVEGYYISDVPGDDPALVGSGLLAPSAQPLDLRGLPPWIGEMLASGPGDAPRTNIPIRCVACLEDALDAVEQAARATGVAVRRPGGRLAGPAVTAAAEAAARLAEGPPALWIWGGETTVVLPPEPGRGGRNQHLALAAARAIAGRDDLLVLAAATDGADGNTSDAGALVDGRTIERGRDAGLEPGDCLRRCDSGAFLEASGDLVHTGATGTNVCDLLLGLRWEEGHSLGWRGSM